MKNFYADEFFDRITDISADFLVQHGIEGVILDVDNTLVGHNVKTPEEKILSHIKEWEGQGIKLCVVSNNTEKRVSEFCSRIGIKYFVANALKPKKKGYTEASEVMGVKLGNIAAIGDQVFTDVWGAKRAGCLAILTKPLYKGGEGVLIAIKRILEKPFIKRERKSLQ